MDEKTVVKENFNEVMKRTNEDFVKGKITPNEARKKVGLKPLQDDFGNCYFKVMK